MYRGVDSDGNTLDFRITAIAIWRSWAIRFFRKAAVHTQEPRVINGYKNAAYPKAIDELKEKEELYDCRWNYDRTNISIM